jgi:hypothetical protein
MLARRSKSDGLFGFSAYQFVYVYPTMHYLSLYSTQFNVLTDRLAGGEDYEVGVIYEDLEQAARGERVNAAIEKGEVVRGLERLDSNVNDARKRIRDICDRRKKRRNWVSRARSGVAHEMARRPAVLSRRRNGDHR